ncbi:hypothetical protein VNO77_22098 [Canavalia gladiata]|uniref:Uncharacterized protein n=1 Tax=Canavalia gladiata TaxID=3824 RepID=A0AAN9L2F6_CANGL
MHRTHYSTFPFTALLKCTFKIEYIVHINLYYENSEMCFIRWQIKKKNDQFHFMWEIGSRPNDPLQTKFKSLVRVSFA